MLFGVYFLVLAVDDQICFLAVSDLPQGRGGIGTLLMGEKTLSTPLLELLTCESMLCVSLLTCCQAHC